MAAEDKTILRVLVDQNEYDRDGNKTGRLRRIKVDGKEIPMKGGVIKDRVGEALGYVFHNEKYDENMERKPEHYIEYDWSK
jgi:hypothetical protein